MGLDMFLEREVFIGAEYEHRNVCGAIHLTVGKKAKPIPIQLSAVSTINERAGYWRKANAIHAWFVENVQGGMDECQRSRVDREQLAELREECREALESGEGMEPQSGCFFGSTEKDDGWRSDLRDTIMIIDNAFERDKELPETPSYYYQASW